MGKKELTLAAAMALLGGTSAQASNISEQDAAKDSTAASTKDNHNDNVYQKFTYNREIASLHGFYNSHFDDALKDVSKVVDKDNHILMQKGVNANGDEVAIGYMNGSLNCITKEKKSGKVIKEKLLRNGISEVEITNKYGSTKVTRAPGCMALVERNGEITQIYDDAYKAPVETVPFEFNLTAKGR